MHFESIHIHNLGVGLLPLLRCLSMRFKGLPDLPGSLMDSAELCGTHGVSIYILDERCSMHPSISCQV